MAPTKTLYVKDSDLPLWDRFERAVKEWQAADSVSALVAEAMNQYLGLQPDGIVVRAPDEEMPTFDDGVRAILEQRGRDWVLTYLDEDGTPEPWPVISSTFPVRDALEVSRRHLAELDADRRSGEMEAIEVEVGDNFTPHTERFVGRWLVVPDNLATRASESDYDAAQWDAGYYWGVAITRRGKVAVYSSHCNRDGGSLTVFSSIEEARESDAVPPSIIAAARAALTGSPVVIDRDI